MVGGFSVFGKVEAGKDTLNKKESQNQIQIQQQFVAPQQPQRLKSALPPSMRKVQSMNQEVIKFIEYGRNKQDQSIDGSQKTAQIYHRAALLPQVKKFPQLVNHTKY